MKVELTPDAALWVQDEIDQGRAPTAGDAVRHAIDAAKLMRLREELAASEAEGGAFSSDDVRRFVGLHLDELVEKSPPER